MATNKRKVVAVVGGGVAAMAAAPVIGSGTAEAAGFVVTNTNDSGPGSLRQAILDANAAGGADVITFDAGVSGTIVLTSGQLGISDSVTITGPGAATLSVSGNNSSRVFYIYNSSALLDVVISGVTITGGAASHGAALVTVDENVTLDSVAIVGNSASGKGGGIFADGFNMAFTLTNSTVSGNSAVDGGGIYVEDTGAPLLIDHTVVSGNTASQEGGGIYFYDPDNSVTIVDSTISGNTAGSDGGGIYLYDTDGGEVVIERTTISGNHSDAAGGGISFYGPDHPVSIVNSTISGNSANTGGGLFFYNGVFAVEHTTIADNTAVSAGGGIADFSQDLTLDHALVANNTAGIDDSDIEVDSGSVNADWSLIEATTVPLVGANNVTAVDPQLAPLQNNGGATETMMPAALSPAVNAGDPAFVAPPATDQRGAARTVGVIDIGAVEVTAVSDDDYSTAEDTPLVVAAPGVLDNDIVSAAPAVVTQPTHGTVAVAADGSFVYTPAANYNGPDSFTYSVTGAPTPATVSITVTPVDDLPVGVADSGTVGSGKSITINVLTNDFDPDGSPLTISGVTQGAKGTVVIDGGNVIYTAKASAAGTDTFTYTITDGVNSLTVTVTVSITPGQIPATGGEELPIFLTGLALVVAGSSLTSVSRRRPREVAAGS